MPDGEVEAGALPRPEDVLRETTPVENNPAASSEHEAAWVRQFENAAVRQQVEYAHLQGIKDHYWHKGRWSYFLMAVLTGIFVFQGVLLGLVGSGVWDFTQYEWLLPALLVQNLAQIAALAVIVVQSLFKDLK